MKRNIVNLLCLFIPSRNTRYRIRKKLTTKTKFEELEESVDMLYYILENCVGVSNIPKAVGKLRKIQEDNIKLIDFFLITCARNIIQNIGLILEVCLAQLDIKVLFHGMMI